MESSKKNIVIIGPAHPLRGGLASYNERLAREFINQGFDVTIYTFSLQYPGFLFPGTTQFSSEHPPADLHIKKIINSVNPFNWFKVGNQIKRSRPDLVIVRYWLPFMGPCLGTILRIIKKNLHSKVVCIADNIIPHEKRFGDKAFTQFFIKPIDGFITMSQKVLNDLSKFSIRTPAKYVPHPLYDNFGNKINQSEAREKIKVESKYPIVLFFGFIRQYKGLDLLFEAISILKKSKTFNQEIKFLIAGEFYEDRKGYDKMITDLGIEDKLILRTDFIPDSEVKYYMCSSDLVVQPYKNATQSGVTPLAYHFEIPMIVTNVGGLPDLVPDHKVGLVSEPNPNSIAEKIETYFNIGKQHFIPGLLDEKKKYSWSVMVNEIFNLVYKS